MIDERLNTLEKLGYFFNKSTKIKDWNGNFEDSDSCL